MHKAQAFALSVHRADDRSEHRPAVPRAPTPATPRHYALAEEPKRGFELGLILIGAGSFDEGVKIMDASLQHFPFGDAGMDGAHARGAVGGILVQAALMNSPAETLAPMNTTVPRPPFRPRAALIRARSQPRTSPTSSSSCPTTSAWATSAAAAGLSRRRTSTRWRKGGMRFEYCYATPLCGPSRCQLLTGRYPFRTGLITTTATAPSSRAARRS